MKKMILSLTLAFMAFSSVSAMSYDEARQQALFLTDKMAYELNLNEQQYEDCYEINLDYLLSVETADDAYGHYLAYRNADLRHILLDWQYTLFAAADYFLHPLFWHRGAWHYPIYRYYSVGRFFYDRPHVYFSYRGGHGRFHYSAGFYGARRPHHWDGGLRGRDHGAVVHHGGGQHHGGGSPRGGDNHSRNGGGYRIGGGQSHHNSGYQHPSSTRTTVYQGTERNGYNSHNSHSNGNRGGFGDRSSSSRNSFSGHSSGNNHNRNSFGGHSSNSSHIRSSFGGHSSNSNSSMSRGGGRSSANVGGMSKSGGGLNRGGSGGHSSRGRR